jgi:hypothetical protein
MQEQEKSHQNCDEEARLRDKQAKGKAGCFVAHSPVTVRGAVSRALTSCTSIEVMALTARGAAAAEGSGARDRDERVGSAFGERFDEVC